jgi:hypothetical protein
MGRGVRGWLAGYLVVGMVVLLGGLVFVAGAVAAGDANQPACSPETESSPGFRSYLPDCRAYEQVTPIFKDGTELEPAALAEGGSSVIAQTLGAFAGLENSTELSGGTYRLARSPVGWTVEAINSSSSAFPTQIWLAASPELADTLWLARGPAESIAAENFYIREANGTMVKIGSLLPPAAVIGPPSGEYHAFLYNTEAEYKDASADLSHVLFEIRKALGTEDLFWPGDGTLGAHSLYEYVGRGQARPVLVGVNGEGRLISRCSTYLGSVESQDLYNAVSGDGSVVFFTAAADTCGASEGPAVNELYARVNGLESVPVSEPSTGSGGSCVACDESERDSAEFAGASRDGSKVFFLTEQALLPGVTPGSGMGLYEYDFDAAPGAHVIRASTGSVTPEVQGVARVSEDGSHVYFVARGVLSTEPDRSLPVGEQEPLAGADNLYVFQRDAQYPAGRVSFIATLCSGEEKSGTASSVAQCPSVESDEADWRAADQRRVQATPDGRFLVFQSFADLTAGDTSSVAQIFEYDSATGELVRVSNGRAGYHPEAKLTANENTAEIPAQGYLSRTLPTTPETDLAVSGDGSMVVFRSTSALTPEAEKAAVARVSSTYEYRSAVADGGSIGEGDVYLISDGVNALKSELEGLDTSGEDLFFRSADSLVPQDSDSQFDTYDARVGGGFPAPDPPAGCVAAACVGSLLVQSLVVPASTVVSGGAPVPAPVVPVVGVKRRGVVVLTRRERLARALRACTRVRRSKRAACEVAALRRYGAHRNVKKPGRGSR